MKTPIDQLLSEHRIIEKALHALLGLCDKLERGERIDPDAFDRMFEFLGTFADRRHHQKEEKCLFPALGSLGVPRDRGPIGVMLQEHCTGRALIAHMKRAANLYMDGDSKAVKQFTDAARAYVDLLSEHIQKEDNVLFRIAQTLLDERSMRELQDEFDQAEAEFPGSEAKYQHEAEEMERAWT
jgi:hemerythrin-like domain-containing protein